ncbi:Ig-like domain-containing protein [Brevibacillus sp. SYSU BS000544]|uniref:Ig-like domain-containing protein n=1 Tax=Brevibacillus sp. SYSU BS000544 TaxID=3416443 RepID=UPI003CE4FAB4
MSLQLKSFRLFMLAFILLVQLVAPATALAAPESGEDNGFIGNAKELLANETVTSEINSRTSEDWYYFTAPESGSVVEFLLKKISYSNTYMYVNLYDESNTGNWSGLASTYVTETTYWDISTYLKPGKRYYLKFTSAAGDAYSYYMSTPPYGSTNAFRGSAELLTYNTDVIGKIDAETKAAWYTLTAPPKTGESVQLLLSNSKNSTDSKYYYLYDAEAYSSGYAYLTSGSVYSGNQSFDLTKFLKGGKKYYIKVTNGYSSTGSEEFGLYLNGPATTPTKTVTSLSLSQTTATLKVDESVNIKATAVYSDGTKEDVTANSSTNWVSANMAIATAATGKITGVKEGSTTVNVSFKDKKSTITVTVTSSGGGTGTLDHLEASESSIILAPKETLDLEVYAIYTNGEEKDITKDRSTTYRSSSNSIVKVTKGVVQAQNKVGTATITISYQGKKLDIPVEVTKAEVESLELSTENVTLTAGEVHQVELTAFYTDGSDKNVTEDAKWLTEDDTVAEVNKGEIIAVGQGFTTVYARYGGQEVAVNVEVIGDSEIIGIEANEKSLKLEVGKEAEVKIYAKYEDGNTRELNDDITWRSKKTSVATVEDGVITAVGVGKTEIVASYEEFEVKVLVEVTAGKEIKTLTITPKTKTLSVGGTYQAKVIATYKDGTKADVTKDTEWASKRDTIASVDNDESKGLVKAIGKGTTTITAKISNKTATISITVK